LTGFTRSAALLAAIIISTPSFSTAKEITRTIPVTEEFLIGGLNWGDGPRSKPSLEYAFKVIAVDGHLEVCGIKVLNGGNKNRFSVKALQEAGVRMNGKSIIRNLNYFAFGKSNAPLVGQLANCEATGQAVPTGDVRITPYFREGRYTE
jgi:hypothetical protein